VIGEISSVGGKKIASIAVHRPKLLVETTEKELIAGTEGVKVSNVERLGPYLVFRLAGGQAMTIRLGAGSWLRKDIPEKAKSKSRKTDSSPPRPEPESDLVISFTQGKPIRLNDPEKTCEVRLLAQEDLTTLPDAAWGMDVGDPVSWVSFGDALLRRSGKLKSILMDQTFLVGSDDLSDEILFTSAC
jgi:formamidopyrimidine-DNA glycosylase